jgi:SAM-dependent methyltransferase
MSKQAKKSSRELGLEVAAICGEHFLKLKHLHYGYWTEGLQPELSNLRKAQEDYTNFLVSHIPPTVQTILDVGCGGGYLAKEMVDRGYRVDCVSPSRFLTERAGALLGEGSHIFECPYEELETEKRYDLVLFSESFQYIRLDQALEKSMRVANDPGYLLICDVFKTDRDGNGTVGGGHKLAKFYDRISNYPFALVEDVDITEQTAPNLDILDDALKNVVQPVLESSMSFLSGGYPLTVKFLRWKYRRKINKVFEKYFNGKTTSEDFKKFKTYRLLLYEKAPQPVAL